MRLTDKTYERLSPDERFRIALEAFARHDLHEVDRLNETCGYVTLRMHGPAYFGRLRGFHEIAMLHGILVREQVIVLMGALFRLSRSILPPAADISDASDATESATAEPSAEDEAVQLFGDTVSQIKGYAQAWEDFCADLSIDPEKTHFTFYKASKESVEVFDEFEVDAEVRTAHLKYLRDAWRHRLEHCRAAEGGN
jgi:hypothetical protein